MRVIHLDSNLFRQFAPVGVVTLKAADDIRQRTGDQKILLHKAQTLPRRRGIVGIQHSRDRFRFQTLTQRAHEVARAKFLKIEGIRRSRRPEPESVDCLSSVAHHWTIEGYANERRRTPWNRLEVAAPQVEGAVQLDFYLLVGTGDLPRIDVPEPIVSSLLLPAIHDRLLEHSIFIAQAITRRWKLHRGHRVEKARREAAEASVPETSVWFLLHQFKPVDALFLKCTLHKGIEQQIGHVVG